MTTQDHHRHHHRPGRDRWTRVDKAVVAASCVALLWLSADFLLTENPAVMPSSDSGVAAPLKEPAAASSPAANGPSKPRAIPTAMSHTSERNRAVDNTRAVKNALPRKVEHASRLVTTSTLRSGDRAVVPAVNNAKLDAFLQGIVEKGITTPQRVLIQVAPGAHAAGADLIVQTKAVIHSRRPAPNLIAATVAGQDLVALSQQTAIARLSIDAVMAGQSYIPDSELTSGQILYRTLGLKKGGGIDTGGKSFAGEKVTVAVVDSGIAVSKDLDAKRIKAFYDFTLGGIVASPTDGYGHGTHVAGLIGGSGAQSSDKHEGIASKVSFVGYKVLNTAGSGYTSDVIAAITHATAYKQQLGIDVINLSLGHPIFEPASTDPLVQAVERAVAAGIVVVVSAGNNGKNLQTQEIGYAGVTSPGNAPSAITVGAVDINNTSYRADDTVPDYSSRGPTWYDAFVKPDIVAPGRRVVAIGAGSLYAQLPGLRVTGNTGHLDTTGKYLRLSGTSMAAAVTSGVVALVLEANRRKDDKFSIQPNAVKAILQFTAIDMGLDDLTQGAGSLNAKGAVRLSEAIDSRVPSGGALGAGGSGDAVRCHRAPDRELGSTAGLGRPAGLGRHHLYERARMARRRRLGQSPGLG